MVRRLQRQTKQQRRDALTFAFGRKTANLADQPRRGFQQKIGARGQMLAILSLAIDATFVFFYFVCLLFSYRVVLGFVELLSF